MSKVEVSLCNFIGINNLSFVNIALNSSSDVDILYKNGKYFKLSIQNNSYEITNVLLEYFKKNQLGKYAEDSSEYLSLESQLKYIFTVIAKDRKNLSPELEESLKPYLLNQGSTTDSECSDISIASDVEDLNKKLQEFNELNNASDKTMDTMGNNSDEYLDSNSE